MSDFFSNGWSVFVAAASIVSMLLCLVLLATAARRRVMSNDNTTGRSASASRGPGSPAHRPRR